jgi:Tol biopolymer transport system component
MGLTPGSRLGAYEIVGLLGAGGMGEVYRATDTNLKRSVAIKILPEAFAADAERLARFQREAEVLASLNHPNIAAIHGLERANSTTALVMEFVEGPTLAERIAGGPIPLDEALLIAKQIAEALEAAHLQGIIHRDLKPANIKVRPDAKVKVLDFGLAKAFTTESVGPSSPALTNSPTITSPIGMTGVGVILGTAAYMAPEQAKGRPIDKRSDIWAFGCVLYEMLTGTRAFDGDDIADALANVLKSEPDWTRLPAGTPPAAQRLLRQCLRKDAKLRVPDISVARFEIEEALAGSADRPEHTPGPQQRSASKGLLFAGAVGILATATGIGGTWLSLRPDRAPLTQLTIQRPDGAPMGTASPAVDLDISLDGRNVVYVAVNNQRGGAQLFVQQLDRLEPLALVQVGNPFSPAFSPDGRSIAYFDLGTRSIMKVPAAGGPPTRIAPYDGGTRGLSWGDDDSIVFATIGSGLMRVPATGGTLETITMPKGSDEDSVHLFPQYLPGARGVLFSVAGSAGPGTTGPEGLQTAVLDLRTREYRVIIPGASSARYVRSGHVVYATGQTLRAARFDLERLEVRGEGMPVVERVATKPGGAASVGVSATGTLAYLRGTAGVVSERTLAWIDRQGREEPIAGAPVRAYGYPRLSPDGTLIALDIRDRGNDTWIFDMNRGTLQQLTFDSGMNRGVAWNRDGTRIAFSVQRDGTENIYWQPADGTGKPEQLTEGKRPQLPLGFTPDGEYLLFTEPAAPPFDMYMVGLADRKIRPLLTSPKFTEQNGEVSPNGRWLAYQSSESGIDEIWVTPFPNVDDGGKRLVSSGGGTRPTWSASGKELFYFRVPDTIMAVPVTTDGVRFAFGNPAVAVTANVLAPLGGRTYAVSADAKRFLVIKNAAQGPTPSPQLVIVLNWLEELKRLVPTN